MAFGTYVLETNNVKAFLLIHFTTIHRSRKILHVISKIACAHLTNHFTLTDVQSASGSTTQPYVVMNKKYSRYY